MYIKERKTKTGVSYELRCSGRDPVTRNNKVYVKTFALPLESIGKKKAIERFLLNCQSEFQAEVDEKSLGTIIAKKDNIKLIDFATEWVEDILKHRKLSHNYYLACKLRLEVLREKLGNYYLNEISPSVIKNFCKWLNERTYKREVVTIKESLDTVIKGKKMSAEKIAKACGVATQTLRALHRGQRISAESVRKICDFLDVPLGKYFIIESKDVPYATSSNKGITIMLHGILKDAVKQELIERNYATSDYVDTVKGAGSKREIFNDEEALQFVKCIALEKDLRKKAAFSIYLELGLRNAEVAGLEWKDIDFDEGTIMIRRNCLYLGSKFGTITKEPKTKSSYRQISIPKSLIVILKEYKKWWDIEKENHGDLWEHTDRLFVQNNGSNMVGTTLARWLREFEMNNGLKDVTPHGLRHTNITMLVKSGVDAKTVSGRVGHADVSTTLNIYSHFTKEADRKAADKIDELFSIM